MLAVSWGRGLNWGRGPSGLAVRLYLLPSMLTLGFLWGRSRVAYVIAAVIVVVLGVALAAILIAVNRHMARNPLRPGPVTPSPDEKSGIE